MIQIRALPTLVAATFVVALAHRAGERTPSDASGASGTVLSSFDAHGASPTSGADVPRTPQYFENPAYNGRFVFTRLRYDGVGRGFGWGGGSAWNHDYPRADFHLSKLLSELTYIHTSVEATNVLEMDDPELFKNPILYISEPGTWGMSDEQVARLREYVLKGGFLIFDDFEGRQFYNMAYQLSRALPEYTPIRIEIDHPIFHSFFDMKEIYIPHPLVRVMPIYWGLFEDNDPNKRMLAIINHNNDIAEYWEYSDQSWFPIDLTNEAYKLGINYATWGMTH